MPRSNRRERIQRSNKTIAELLLDQKVLAGVGNVYRAEVLWRHRLSPFTPGKKVKRSSWLTIWNDLVRLMPLGVATHRIVTIEEEVQEVEARLTAGEEVDLERRDSAVYKQSGACGAVQRSGPKSSPAGTCSGAGAANGACERRGRRFRTSSPPAANTGRF